MTVLIGITPDPALPGAHVDVLLSGLAPKTKYALETLDANGILSGRANNEGRSTRAGKLEAGIWIPKTLGRYTIRVWQGSTIVATFPGTVVATQPAPPPPPPTGYDTTFQPQGSGVDETTRLENWARATDGKRRAIYGDVAVRSTALALTGGALDFVDGAQLHANQDNALATLGFYQCHDVVINKPKGVGRGYGTYHADKQWQHGIAVYGGSNVQINSPATRDTFGDGIDVDVMGSEATPTGIVIRNPDIQRACRNSITLNAGQGRVEIGTGALLYAGLHNVDAEPNGDREALSIDWQIIGPGRDDRVVLAHHDDFPVRDPGSPDIVGFAVAGGGYSHAMKKRIELRGIHADDFTFAVGFATKFVLVDCRSDVAVGPGRTRFTDRNGSNEISGLVNITPSEWPFF